MLLALVLALGVQSTLRSARSVYPRVSFPRIAVIAERGEQPVRGMLVEVTRPLEQAVTVPGLVRLRSKTVRGASELSLDFAEGADMQQALSYVRARIGAAGLPPDVQCTIEQQTPAVFPVISFNVLPGPATARDAVARARLREWTELELAPRLMRLPDAFRVTVQSGDQREFVYEPDPLALLRVGLDVLDVERAIADANAVAAVGRAAAEGLQYQLLVDGQFRSPDDVLAVAVPRDGREPVPLRELGRVVETTAERTMVVTGGSADGVVVSVFLRDDGKVTDLSAGVGTILAEQRPLLPAGATLAMVYDQAQLVDASIAGVRDAIGIGALLAVLVMALFLGSWRITLVAGIAIPVSVVATLALFPLHDESLNLMSLGGLAVAIGFVIDDAIVVVENVARRLQHGGAGDAMRAVGEGTVEMVPAIVGSSLTTVVVFAPLVLMSGVVGQFFRSLAFALTVSIVVSMVVALVYTPLLLLLRGLRPRGELRPRAFVTWLQDRYTAALQLALAAPGACTAGAAALLLVGGTFALRVPTDFLPSMDEGGFVLDYWLPVGTSLDATDAACRRIEAVLLSTPEVRSLSRRTGAELGFFATEQFTGDMLVGLHPRGERARSVFAVIDGVRERLQREVPQAQIEFVQVMQDTIADLEGNPEPIEVRVLGADYPELQGFANAVAARIEHLPGIVDVTNHVSFGSPELSWRPDPVAAARLGLTTRALAAELSAQLLGTVATRVRQQDRFVDLRVRYPQAWRTVDRGDDDGPPVWVHGRGDAPFDRVPLRQLATFERRLAENELERDNQVPMVRVTAAVAGTDLGSASRAVAAAIEGLPKPSGVRCEIGGQVESQQRAFEHLVVVAGLGIGLVFLLLVAQFRSLSLPLAIFLALPFGQIGGLLALRTCGVPLNVSSGMGLIMLVGLVVKNGIILIEHSQQLRARGAAPRDAIVAAARTRLRPILMTTLCAIAGLLPLALGLGAGAELQRPLAIAVVGGLVVSTLCGLFVVPLACLWFADRQRTEVADGLR